MATLGIVQTGGKKTLNDHFLCTLSVWATAQCRSEVVVYRNESNELIGFTFPSQLLTFPFYWHCINQHQHFNLYEPTVFPCSPSPFNAAKCVQQKPWMEIQVIKLWNFSLWFLSSDTSSNSACPRGLNILMTIKLQYLKKEKRLCQFSPLATIAAQ